jgi:single-stranded-DNA-specific exonuclease
MAAGFSLPEAGLAAFHEFLNARLAAAAALPSAADLTVEGTVTVPGCTTELAQQISLLAPFGNGNEEPVLALPRVRVVRADRVGRDSATIRTFVQGEEGTGRVKAMLFRAADGALAEALLRRDGSALHLAGHLRAEEWNGFTSAGFIINDAALA